MHIGNYWNSVIYMVVIGSIKIDYGQKLGQTIIFATNHVHVEKMLEIENINDNAIVVVV